jgi:wyosine [tRNA(Phe)-imidazoG37] synthetase (radical SAM superfamily)
MRKYVFGPINSRRLGVSLGVDLVPLKVCPLDCVYCEARATTVLTMERKEYVPVDRVLEELEETLSRAPELDYITFSGSGEPTLNSRIGDVVKFLKRRYPQYKVCLLTNGLLLGDVELQADIAGIDLLIPSLDGSNAAEYEAVNRPVSSMPFEKFLAALKDYLPTAPMPSIWNFSSCPE